MSALWQDLRYGARALTRSRHYAVAAVLTLTIGVGVAGAAFSVADAVLFRPLPFPQSDRLVLVHEATPSVPDMFASYPNFLDWKAQSRSFTAFGAFRRVSMNLTGTERAERVSAVMASADLFRALQVEAAHGRGLAASDDRPGAEPVAVLDHRFWASRFHSDPAVVGKTVTLEGRNFAVVGVMPAFFRLPTVESDLWVPMGQWAGEEEFQDRGNHPDILVLGRLADGVGLDAARADLAEVAVRLEEQYPETNRKHAIVVTGWQESLVAPVRRTLLIVLAAATLVLLISWVNIGNLMVAQALRRQAELAMRAALGASRGRLVRQLLAESALVAGLGLAVGLPLAAVCIQGLASLATAQLPRLDEVAVDLRVVSAVGIATLLSGMALTLAPALHAVRGDLARGLARGGTGAVAGRGQHWLRGLLIVNETALALLVLACATLLLVSFQRLAAADPGFSARGVLTAGLSLSSWKYGTPESRAGLAERLLDRTAALPGVTAAAVAYPLPLGGEEWSRSYAFEGQPEPGPGEQEIANSVVASPEYFAALAIPLRRGRTFGSRDVLGRPGVVIVDESLAARCWPGQDPLGKRLKLNGSPSAPEPWLEVVGVVGSVRSAGVDSPPAPTLYVPYAQDPATDVSLIVRTDREQALAADLRAGIAAVDPDQPVHRIRPLAAYLADGRSRSRLALLLMGCFAGTAVFLAAIGTYSVMAQSVDERRQEIGVRVALGAEPRQVVGLVIGQLARFWAVGLALGLGLALAAAAPLAPMLYRTPARDPLVLATVTLLLAVIALLASYLPARRALDVEPVAALKSSV